MFLILFLFQTALANNPLSSIRNPNLDYSNYFSNAILTSSSNSISVSMAAEDIINEPWNKTPLSGVSPSQMQMAFESIRDFKPLIDSKNRPRRLTWLYPDDGCYARSAISQSKMVTLLPGAFHQIFIFGNLYHNTKNHPNGQVHWWYHVAPVIRISSGVFVFDPSIDHIHPMPINRWIQEVLPQGYSGKISICNVGAYGPQSDCYGTATIPLNDAQYEEQNIYLDQEWQRVIDLGRIPEKELGSNPPWQFQFYNLK